ncbi:hypothetical protein Tco_0363487 [Tanacetum coccineum]
MWGRIVWPSVVWADISTMVIDFVKFPIPMMYLRASSFQNIQPRRFLRSGSHSNVGCKKSCQSSKYGSDLGQITRILSKKWLWNHEDGYRCRGDHGVNRSTLDSIIYVTCALTFGLVSRGSLLISSVALSLVHITYPFFKESYVPFDSTSILHIFDVLVGMDRLSKRKFGIVCHGKVVRIPLEGDEILQVHGERTQGVVKTLMNTKVVEFRVDLVPGATPVAKSPYRLTPLEMQELSEQLQELQDEEEHGVHLKLELELLRNEKLYAKKWRVKLRRVRAMSMTIQSSVKDKILAAPSETSKYEYEISYHLDRANVVIEALRRKERVKPRRDRAMAMIIQYRVRAMILAAQSEAFKQENGMMRTVVMDEAHVSSIGGRSFEPAAIILLCIWLSVEDVLTGVDMMNE